MAQTSLFAKIDELPALNVFTFVSSRFTVLSVPFKVIVPKTNQLTCHSFSGDLYVMIQLITRIVRIRLQEQNSCKQLCSQKAPDVT